MAKRRGNAGMSLIEVAIALGLLSLIAVMLMSSIMVLSRGDMLRVDVRARANTTASQYLETVRAKIRGSSFAGFKDVNDFHPTDNYVIPGTPFTVDVQLTPGSVGTGAFVPYVEGGPLATPTPKIPLDATTGQPLNTAAVKVVVTVSWENSKQSVVRRSVLVPSTVAESGGGPDENYQNY